MVYIVDNAEHYSAHAIYFIEGSYSVECIEAIAKYIFRPEAKVIGTSSEIKWLSKIGTTTIEELIDQYSYRCENDEGFEKLTQETKEILLPILKRELPWEFNS
jgi:hypothetical protein